MSLPCPSTCTVAALVASLLFALPAIAAADRAAGPAPPPALAEAAAAARADLVQRFGGGETPRIDRGIAQVLRYWRPEDGGADALGPFLREQFVPAGPRLDATFARLEYALERQDGYLSSLSRDWRRGVDLALDDQLPVDGLLAAFDPSAHVAEDAFRGRIAFVALLNFPETTLEERMRDGGGWSRRQWAEARLADRFTFRVPAGPLQAFAAASAASDAYINGYNVHVHHVLTAGGERLFPPGLRLISHWNLRDEIKARYSEPGGLEKQRLLQLVMEKIVRQEIPRAVIDNPRVDWTPATGAVVVSPVADVPAPANAPAQPSTDREPDERYRYWLDVFRAARQIDPHDPRFGTQIARAFEGDREIPEAQVVALFEAVLASPLGAAVAKLAERRLGRPLEPFDVWYAGFRARAEHPEPELDALTKKRYPTAEAFARDLPRILGTLGFAKDKAAFLAERIVVEPSRGAGHAFGAARRDEKAHLRTRVGPGGMDYKGYNIAVHELGHNCEQLFSTAAIDHTLLRGVPNTAFTEAMAFLFQARDLELLGLSKPSPESRRLDTISTFWATREIAGVALLDIAAWHWLYDHPDATPAEFRAAVVQIAGELWNRWYAPLLGGRKDVPLLAIYSHLVEYGIYTPDYPLGHLIAFQVQEHFDRPGSTVPFGAEFERVTKLGRLTPDAWMRAAVGAPLSAEPLLRATEKALSASR